VEDDLNYLEDGRQPQFFHKMEDDLNFLAKWKMTSNHLNLLCKAHRRCKTTSIILKMEDKLNFLYNGRQTQFLIFLAKWKTNSISEFFSKMEDDLNI
jgi:hypothetical protein